MESYELLEQAKALIADENNWCTNTVHRRRNWDDQYCAIGAMNMVSTGTPQWKVESLVFLERNDRSARDALISAAKVVLTNRGIQTPSCSSLPVQVNNYHGHAATMEMFNLAIRDEKARLGVVIDVPSEKPERIPVTA